MSHTGDSGNCLLSVSQYDSLFDLGDNNYRIRQLKLYCRVTSDKYVFKEDKSMNNLISGFSSGSKVTLSCCETNRLTSSNAYYGDGIDFVIENVDPPEYFEDGTDAGNLIKDFGGKLEYNVQVEDTGWATIDGFTGDHYWYRGCLR